ncbi:MAG TPA: GNAT family N-acetyltransferase [Patescibacteria group bacterium]|nr:GNAT family N-acetyltransferase [Patescibacteria group bacterium]
MNNNIKILPARPEDAKRFREIQKITWLQTYPNEELGITREDIDSKTNEMLTPERTEEIAEIIKNTDTSVSLVAKDGGEIVGFMGVDIPNRKIAAIFVLPEYQEQGIGRALLEKGLEQLGAGKISLNVVSYNQKAINFYKKLGFVENGPTSDDPVIFASGKVLPKIEMVKN